MNFRATSIDGAAIAKRKLLPGAVYKLDSTGSFQNATTLSVYTLDRFREMLAASLGPEAIKRCKRDGVGAARFALPMIGGIPDHLGASTVEFVGQMFETRMPGIRASSA